jgi:hypothetical protein
MQTPSSGLKNKQRMTLLHVGFLLDLFFNPEDGSDVFLRYAG